MNPRDQQAARRLEELLGRVESFGRRIRFDDLRELARMYRLCSARLAILRSRRAGDPDEIRYLNALCVRAYSHLRVEPPRRRRLGRFFMADFPATLAATAWLQLLTATLMLVGVLLGATLVAGNPAALYACVPASMYRPSASSNSPTPPHSALISSSISKLPFSSNRFFRPASLCTTSRSASRPSRPVF